MEQSQSPQQVIPKEENQSICQFIIKRKKRQCKFIAVKGSKYCSAHCSDLEDKVECPYEKGFFVSAAKLEKHLKNCPKLMNKRKEQQSEWFNRDINKGENHQIQAQIHIAPLVHIENERMDHISKTIIRLYLKHFQEESFAFISSTPKEDLQETTNDHLQAQLITQKAYENKMIAPQFVYVQFGAGKGILSYAIADKIKRQFNRHSHNILLQRESRRNKFDRFFKDNPYFQRFKGDVSNFDFTMLPRTMANTAIKKCGIQESVEEIENRMMGLELIGVCKHMCGQALDISMRGLLQGNSKGCILASCCHHLCKYNTYLNPAFFQRQGLSPQQIQILFRISSWGTMSHMFDPLPQDIFERLSNKDYSMLLPDQKILVGRMCKRLIDKGRAQYLSGRLYRYCSDQLTPQNYVIISRV